MMAYLLFVICFAFVQALAYNPIPIIHPMADGMITKILCRPNYAGPIGNIPDEKDKMEQTTAIVAKKDEDEFPGITSREVGEIEKVVTSSEKVTSLDPIADGMIAKIVCRPNKK